MSMNDEYKASSAPTEKFDEHEKRQRRREQLGQLKRELSEINSNFRRLVDLRKQFDAKYVLLGFVAACLWLGPMWGQIAFGWITILSCCSMGFYKWRKTDAFIYEIMTLYEHDILTGRIPDRPWYRDRYLSGIIIGAAALSGNSAYMLLVQEGDWNLKMNAVAIGSSAANLLLTWARVESECVSTLQDKLDGKFDSGKTANVEPSP